MNYDASYTKNIINFFVSDKRIQLMDTSYKGKIFPTQPFFNYLYSGAVPFESAVYDIISAYSIDFSGVDLKIAQHEKMPLEEMSTPPHQLALMNFVIKLSGAKKILEIGTFVGKSTMHFLKMIEDGGHVTTIEAFDEFADIAESNFINNNMEKNITLLRGDAGHVLEDLAARKEKFDLVFVDGSKQDYLSFTLKAKDMLTNKGVIFVDDVFFHGDALNDSPANEKGVGCRDVIEYFKNYNACERLLLPVSNGVLLLYNFR